MPDESTVFNAARRIEDPAARRRYVTGACGGDPAFAARVEALLRMHDEDPNFLASPAQELGDFHGTLNEPPTLPPGGEWSRGLGYRSLPGNPAAERPTHRSLFRGTAPS